MKTSEGGRGSVARVLGRGKVLSGGQVPRASKNFCPLEAGKKMVNTPPESRERGLARAMCLEMNLSKIMKSLYLTCCLLLPEVPEVQVPREHALVLIRISMGLWYHPQGCKE